VAFKEALGKAKEGLGKAKEGAVCVLEEGRKV
jgi:DNA integrity scanning protein DisA with diadenylate cyclase activity